MKLVHVLLSLGLLAIWMSASGIGASHQRGTATPRFEQLPSPSAFLGADMGDNDGWGVSVLRVVSDSSASDAGVRAGDRILGLSGKVVESTEGLRTLLTKYRTGDQVQLVFRRESELHVVRLVFVDRPAVMRWNDAPAPKLERVLEFVGVQPGQVLADIGCGYGWLTIGLAEATGPQGKVFGLEIEETLITELRKTSIANLTWVRSQENDLTLGENLLDLAVLHDVASHVQERMRPEFYASVARALKPTGKLIVFSPHGHARAMLDELATFHFIPDKAQETANLSTKQLDERLRRGLRFSCMKK